MRLISESRENQRRAACRPVLPFLFSLLACSSAVASSAAPAKEASLDRRLYFRAGPVDPLVKAATLPPGPRALASSQLFVVQLATPSRTKLRARLESLGAEILAPFPEHAHVVRYDPKKLDQLRAQDFVRWVGRYHPAQRMAAGVFAQATSTAQHYVLLSFSDSDAGRQRLADAVENAGGKVLLRGTRGRLFEARLDRAQLLQVVHSDELEWIERYTQPGDDMDHIRNISGVDFVETSLGIDGAGVAGEVLDGGVDEDHPDFDGIRIHGTTTNGDHGTACYGIVFGNGDRDGDGEAAATGLLPAADGWFADYGEIGPRHDHTAEILEAPIHGVFQSNSWGSDQTTEYTNRSVQMEDIVWDLDLAIFQSQSNEGNRDSRPQAWAKNLISVGGLRSQNTLDPDDDCWCDGASIGPAEDGRIKPDLAHYFHRVYTTDRDPDGYDGGLYTQFGGTSAATPIVAGLSGAFFRMWSDNVLGNDPVGITVFDRRPHAATMKALMINTAWQYPFDGPNHDLTRAHQGWGLPNPGRFLERAPVISVIDETSPLQEMGVDVYSAELLANEADGELKVTLVYTDPAGTPGAARARVNDLSLRVTAPDGTEYWGNNGLLEGNWSLPGGTADVINTVENVYVADPAEGTWTVEVLAVEILEDQLLSTPEDDVAYALVVNGASNLLSCADWVNVPADVTATATGDNEVTVSWTGSADSFRVFRAGEGCTEAELIAEVDGAQTSFVDAPVSGGITQGYVVRAVVGCESHASECATVVPSGPCTIAPTFPGLRSAVGRGTATCGIRLDWDPATSTCGGSIVYNVHRSTDPGFVPDATNLIAECLMGTTHLDEFELLDGERYHYVVRASDSAGGPPTSCGGLEDSNELRVSTEPGLLSEADFEDGFEGWVELAGAPAASRGGWVVGDPIGTQSGGMDAQPEDDHTPGGTNCLYTARNAGGNAGQDDVDEGEVVIVSPVFDASGPATLELTFWRWHFNRDVNEDPDDYYVLELSNDAGAGWTTLEQLDSSASANAWTEVVLDLAAALPLTSQMQLRVRSSDGEAEGNLIETAIDDISIRTNAPCATLWREPGVVTGAPALRVNKSASGLQLEWGADCGEAETYGVYRGDLALGYDSLSPVPGLCDLPDLRAELALEPGQSQFFLVAPLVAGFEGSLGLRSDGLRRVQPSVSCYPRATPVAECAP